MTVQIALCDDEVAELKKTEEILDAYKQKHRNIDFIIERFKSADELLYMVRVRNYSPHLIFMDIYMPGETGGMAPLGIEAAKRLRDMGNEAKLVFLTASRKHALDAFEVDAFQYMLKPIHKDRLFSLLDQLLKETEGEREKFMLLRVGRQIRKVPVKDVVYCEAQKKQQCIYLADGTEVLQNLTLTKLYEMCSACQALVKVGASYIIHLEHIDSLNAREAQMDNGQIIYLPRGTYRCLRKQYFDYYTLWPKDLRIC